MVHIKEPLLLIDKSSLCGLHHPENSGDVVRGAEIHVEVHHDEEERGRRATKRADGRIRSHYVSDFDLLRTIWSNIMCSPDICFPVVVAVGARYSSVARAFAHGAMGRRIDPSWGGPIELFIVPASAPRLVLQMLWYVLSCLWYGAYKRTLAANRKE